MLSSPFLSSLPPLKSFHIDQIQCAPILKDRILILGSRSKSFLGARMRRVRVSHQINMTKLAEIDTFGGSNCLALNGFESTLNEKSKWLVAALFGLAILWKHDAEAMWVAMGSVVNSLLSVTLKQILNHQRPSSALRSDPGMPSSHAQSIFYIAFFGVLSLFQWLGLNVFSVSVGSAILICGSYLSWLRVSQKLHTLSQVAVGAIVGSTCSITWFWMWHSFVLEAFIASIWVRIIVVLGSITFCVAFVRFVVAHRLKDE